jgi:hypothetical protein
VTPATADVERHGLDGHDGREQILLHVEQLRARAAATMSSVEASAATR